MGGFGPLFFYIHMRDHELKPPKGNTDIAMRKCLSCDEMFKSEFNGNRMCYPCKQNLSDAMGLPQNLQECPRAFIEKETKVLSPKNNRPRTKMYYGKRRKSHVKV